jgi:soluble lytic murein transglycosylase-like protein
MRTTLRALAVALMLCLAAAPATSMATPRSSHKQPSCWNKHGQTKIAKCFITRAAKRYGQSRGQALYIAHRESRYNWRVTNSSSGAAGLYQFMPRTWQSTPYRKHSPYHPKWAALAAMWMWKRGGQSHWAL